MAQNKLNVPYYQEEEVGYGGAAVMQMTLESIPLPPFAEFPPPLFTKGQLVTQLPKQDVQKTFYQEATALNDPNEPAGTWQIDPEGLQYGFNKYYPHFVDGSVATKIEDANSLIRSTIDQYGVPPAVLVSKALQWLAVTGYETNNEDKVKTFWVHDPRPPVDIGTGDLPYHQVAADTAWKTLYLLKVEKGVRWKDKFVLVRDPRVPEGTLAAAKQKPRADGRKIIEPQKAVKFAKEILQESGLIKNELMAKAVRDGAPAKPQLVRMLHREQFYYLVRFQIARKDAAVVSLDARYGVLLEAIAYPKPVNFFKITPGQIPGILEKGITLDEPAEKARDRIIDHLMGRIDLKQPGAIPGWDLATMRTMLDTELARMRQPSRVQRFLPEEVTVHPTMVWQPSAESALPLYPYYAVHTLKGPLYVRAADGLIISGFKPWFLSPLGG